MLMESAFRLERSLPEVVDADRPIYPIGVASEILEVHPRTLRLYEAHGLISPARRGRKRYFSENDIKWIRCIRALIHEDGISIEGIRRLLKLQHCWDIRNCSEAKRAECSAFRQSAEPCWKLASRACAMWRDTCFKCEVFTGRDKGSPSGKSSAGRKRRGGGRRPGTGTGTGTGGGERPAAGEKGKS